MRSDMAKIMVLRPRPGGRWKSGTSAALKHRARDLEYASVRGPMSRGRGTKDLSENFAPLKRYLRSQVGRPWDQVYSEISRHLRATSAVQQHVRDHLEDFVVTRTWIEEGRVHGVRWWHPIDLEAPAAYPYEFYVGRGGILRERRVAKRKHTPSISPDVCNESDSRQLRRIGGVWYALTLEAIPRADQRHGVFDRTLGVRLDELLKTREGASKLSELYGRAGVYASAKRQLGKRELKSLEASQTPRTRRSRRKKR